MERRRQLLGIAFLVLALGGLIAWESWGRGYFLTEEVLLAKDTIAAGTELSAGLFVTAKVEKGSAAEGAITPQTASKLQGKVAAGPIPANGQISLSQMKEQEFALQPGQSLYVLKGEWIALRSSSLRRGDCIDVYAVETGGAAVQRAEQEAVPAEEPGRYLGTYRVAFVKDKNEVEVLDSSGRSTGDALERTDSTTVIHQVEIIASKEEYEALLQGMQQVLQSNRAASETAGKDANGLFDTACLLLVQKEKK